MTTIRTCLPSTGFREMPTETELAKLRQIVLATHPWLTDNTVEPERAKRDFGMAFWAANALFFRTETVSTSRYFSSFTDDANEALKEHGEPSISGKSFLAACLACADIVWQRADPSVGVLLGLGLNRYTGRQASSRWRQLLAGEANLLAPVAPPARLTCAQTAPMVRVYQEHPVTGEMVLVTDNRSLWSR